MTQKNTNTKNMPPKVKKDKKKIKREIASVLNKNTIMSKKLLGMNPYAQTLLDPFNRQGVRIPDECQFPSVPFTIIDRRTLTINAQGIAAIFYGSQGISVGGAGNNGWYGSLVPVRISGAASANSYIVGCTAGNAATAADLLQASSSISFPQWGVGGAATSAFDKVRLVSAGLNVQFTGNYTQTSGKFTAVSTSRGYLRSNFNSLLSIDQISKFPGSIVTPIALEQGVSLRYSPTDTRSLEYHNQAQGGMQYPIGNANPAASTSDWEIFGAAAEGCDFIVTLDGCPAGATVQCTFVGNYEGVPGSNTFLLNGLASTSQSDPIALAHGLRASEQIPNSFSGSAEVNNSMVASVGDQQHFSVLPPAVSKSTEPSMFDSLLGMLERGAQAIGPVLKGALPLAESLLAAV